MEIIDLTNDDVTDTRNPSPIKIDSLDRLIFASEDYESAHGMLLHSENVTKLGITNINSESIQPLSKMISKIPKEIAQKITEISFTMDSCFRKRKLIATEVDHEYSSDGSEFRTLRLKITECWKLMTNVKKVDLFFYVGMDVHIPLPTFESVQKLDVFYKKGENLSGCPIFATHLDALFPNVTTVSANFADLNVNEKISPIINTHFGEMTGLKLLVIRPNPVFAKLRYFAIEFYPENFKSLQVLVCSRVAVVQLNGNMTNLKVITFYLNAQLPEWYTALNERLLCPPKLQQNIDVRYHLSPNPDTQPSALWLKNTLANFCKIWSNPYSILLKTKGVVVSCPAIEEFQSNVEIHNSFISTTGLGPMAKWPENFQVDIRKTK